MYWLGGFKQRMASVDRPPTSGRFREESSEKLEIVSFYPSNDGKNGIVQKKKKKKPRGKNSFNTPLTIKHCERNAVRSKFKFCIYFQ